MIFNDENPDWVIISKDADLMHSELLKNELESNGIHAVLVNKKDSNYPMFGSALLYVPVDQQHLAKVITDNFNA